MARAAARAGEVHLKLEVVLIRVSDVDRSKKFYEDLGWTLDADFGVGEAFDRPVHASRLRLLDRVRQGSHAGRAGLGQGPRADRLRHRGGPRRARRARPRRVRGVPRLPVLFRGTDQRAGPRAGTTSPTPPSRIRRALWLLQEVTVRLPGRIDSAQSTFVSVADLACPPRRRRTSPAAASGRRNARAGPPGRDPALHERHGGRRTAPGLAFISALTAAIPAMTKHLALELAPIRVNLIAPGFVDTPLSATLLADQLDARREQLRTTLPIRRVVGPTDIAALALHLMTNTAVTGATSTSTAASSSSRGERPRTAGQGGRAGAPQVWRRARRFLLE